MSSRWLRGLFSPKGKPGEFENSLPDSSGTDLPGGSESPAIGLFPETDSAGFDKSNEPVRSNASFPPPPPSSPISFFDFQEGQTVAELFRIGRIIGRGLLCTNYLVRQERWETDVVLKVPNEMLRADPGCLECIQKAAESWINLGVHPNIVLCHRILSYRDVPLLVVEYLDGGNLRDWIAEGWCADLKLGLDLALQFCHALEYAHSRGQTHRALKPENVLLLRDGTLKVSDFGMVFPECTPEMLEKYRLLAGMKNPWAPGAVSTPTLPCYFAPEQQVDGQIVDARSDIFAFGVCLYEMFCGSSPYQTTYGPRQEVPDPHVIRGDNSLPGRLCRLLKRCVEWERHRRPPSLGEVRKELVAIYVDLFQQTSSYAQPPDVAGQTESEEPKRMPWLEAEKEESSEENDRAIAFLEQGSLEEARQTLEQILKAGTPTLEAVFNHTLLLWRQGEIDDLEALRRLDRMINAPGIKPRSLAIAKAEIHQERCDPASSRKTLEEYPGLYDKLFAERESPQITSRGSLRGHSKSGPAVAITPDGRRGLSGSNDHSLRLWDLGTGKILHTVDLGTSGACTVALAGDGTIGLADAQKTFKLWDMQTGRCLRTFTGHTNYVVAVAITPDGRRAVSGGWDKTLRLWDVTTGDCLAVMEGHSHYITAVAITPDGRQAVSASWDYTLKVWDLETHRWRETLSGHTNYVISLAQTPDGKLGLSGSTDKTMRLWDLETGRCLRIFTGHGNWVDAVALTADGRWALSGSKDKTLKLWDLSSGQCVRTLEGHAGGISSVSLTPDGRLGLSGSQDSTLRLWDLTLSYRQLAEFKTSAPERVPRSVFEPASPAARVSPAPPAPPPPIPEPPLHPPLRSAETRIELPVPPQPIPDPVLASLPAAPEPNPLFAPKPEEFLKPGKTAGSSRQTPDAIAEQDSVFLQVETLFSQGHYKVAFDRLLRNWSEENFRIDTRHIHYYHQLHQVGIPINLRHVLRRFSCPGLGEQLVVALTADGSRGISGGSQQNLVFWDLGTGTPLRILEGHKTRIASVAMTPDGRQAMSADQDRTVRVWNLESGTCLRTLEGVSPLAVSVVLTGDGRRGLSAAENHTVKFWDLKGGQCLQTLEGHCDRVTAVAITTDGRLGLSGSDDLTLRLWDMEAGTCMYTLEGHQGGITAVALAPDGKRALSSSRDRTLKFWDLATGDCLHTLEVESIVGSIAVTPGCSTFITGQENGVLAGWLMVWNLDFPEE